jgi:hypothetical protein
MFEEVHDFGAIDVHRVIGREDIMTLFRRRDCCGRRGLISFRCSERYPFLDNVAIIRVVNVHDGGVVTLLQPVLVVLGMFETPHTNFARRPIARAARSAQASRQAR